jgi:hypothetical protein
MTELKQPNKDDTNEQPQATPSATPKRSSRRTFLLAGVGIGAVALLGGAAYAAGNLMNGQLQVGGGGNGFSIGTGPGGQQNVQLKMPPIKNAPQIPSTSPDATGLFLRRQDQSLFLGTGRIQMMFQKDSNGQMHTSATNDGPEVEVVVNHDTALYVDKTPITMEAAQSGQTLQQVVEPVESLDAMTANLGKSDVLSAWGQKVGSRVIAKVLLYRPPMVQPPPGAASGGK